MPAAAAAARAFSASCGAVTMIVAPESFSWRASSSAPYIGLAVVLVPPSSATAKKTAAYSGTFGLYRQSTSPRPKPRARSAARQCSISVRSPPYVSTRPLDPSMSAGSFHHPPACSKTNSPSVTSGIGTSGKGLRKIISALVS